MCGAAVSLASLGSEVRAKSVSTGVAAHAEAIW